MKEFSNQVQLQLYISTYQVEQKTKVIGVNENNRKVVILLMCNPSGRQN